MKIGILETGRPPRALQDQFGDYPAMFMDLLGRNSEPRRSMSHRENCLDPDEYEACSSPGRRRRVRAVAVD